MRWTTRQRARLVRHVAGYRFREPGPECQPGPAGWFLDHRVDLGVGHRPDEELALGEQPRELRVGGEAAGAIVGPAHDHDGNEPSGVVVARTSVSRNAACASSSRPAVNNSSKWSTTKVMRRWCQRARVEAGLSPG